jgi:hypothetical protein
MKSPKPCYNVFKDKEKGHKMKVWLIVVEPMQGWGIPWYYIFKDGDKAVTKFKELITKYELDSCDINCAISAGNNKKHIERISLQPTYTYD